MYVCMYVYQLTEIFRKIIQKEVRKLGYVHVVHLADSDVRTMICLRFAIGFLSINNINI